MPAVNGVGELGAGEPHAQFEVAGAGNGATPVGHLRVPGRCAEKRRHDGLVGTQPTVQSLPRQRSTLLHNHMCESWKHPGRYYLLKWPSDRAMASIKAKVRDLTDRRYVGLSLNADVDRLNPVLRGWAAYFRHGNSSRKFTVVNSYVHERIAILASNKYGRSGRNWATRFNYGWFTSIGVYRLTGTVHYGTAHALR